MKILLLILFSIFLFSGHIFVDNVFSQQEITITAQTTKDSYDAGETVTVGGTIQNYDYSSNSNIAVTYQTKDPSGNLVTIGQASPNTKGIFSFNFETGGSLYKESGQYTIQLIFNSVKKDIVFSYKGGSFEATEPESSSKPPPPDESKISIEIPGDATFFLNSPNQIIRAYVEIPNFAPSDGTYFMKVTHILSQKVLKDFEIYPKNFGNDIWGVNVAYPLQRTDVTFG
ncbi:MAG: hypothetical protein R3237_05875, partial [Nitrosopumilaceae archaeon]|nr:hypothetical protein [Nitrosopumilaceae archaeon]